MSQARAEATAVGAGARTTARAGVVAAVDLGATSGRVVLGRIVIPESAAVRTDDPNGAATVELTDVHRFPNQPVRTRDGLHWDILGLYREVLTGLRKALVAAPDLRSVGIDSWAVDYALLRGERMVGTPYHYRDERTACGVELVSTEVAADRLYAANGLQFLPFNTVYQLAVDAEQGLLNGDTTMLLVPDLVAFWLTGSRRAERTNASTTGLLGVGTRRWDTALAERVGLPAGLLPNLVDPGERIGTVTDDVMVELAAADRNSPLDVVAVGSHDTASAVAAVPMTSRRSAFICSGTWSLVGVELDDPVVTEASRVANFTNEGGVDDRIRFLRNAMGMWLVNECVNAWNRDRGEDRTEVDLPSLVDAAALVDDAVVFDVDDPSLLPAGDMPSRITALAPTLNGAGRATVLRSILESLAVSYADVLDRLRELTGVDIDRVHIVGGASQNALLCQLIADRCGREVVAGPVEATAAGNVLVQARAAGLIRGSLEDLRRIMARSVTTVAYQPRHARPGTHVSAPANEESLFRKRIGASS